MGFLFSKIFSGLVGSEQMRIIIIGLDNAGKTTILCKPKLTIKQNLSLQTSYTLTKSFKLYQVSATFSLMRNLFSCRVQCRDRHLQKPKIPSVGPRWLTRSKALLALLLSRYKCGDLCRWLHRQRASWILKTRVGHYATGGRIERCTCPRASEQVRFARCDDRAGDF